jgi:hypothetical protein
MIKINNIEVSEQELRRVIKENPQLLNGDSGRVKEGEEYWYVTASGTIQPATEDNHYVDDGCYALGNYHHTKQEAEAKRNYEIALTKVRRAIKERNGDWKIDWKASNFQKKFFLHFDNVKNKYYISDTYDIGYTTPFPYMKSEEIAQSIIKDFKPELDIIRNNEF